VVEILTAILKSAPFGLASKLMRYPALRQAPEARPQGSHVVSMITRHDELSPVYSWRLLRRNRKRGAVGTALGPQQLLGIRPRRR
jgi:hypothetical protein